MVGHAESVALFVFESDWLQHLLFGTIHVLIGQFALIKVLVLLIFARGSVLIRVALPLFFEERIFLLWFVFLLNWLLRILILLIDAISLNNGLIMVKRVNALNNVHVLLLRRAGQQIERRVEDLLQLDAAIALQLVLDLHQILLASVQRLLLLLNFPGQLAGFARHLFEVQLAHVRVLVVTMVAEAFLAKDRLAQLAVELERLIGVRVAE